MVNQTQCSSRTAAIAPHEFEQATVSVGYIIRSHNRMLPPICDDASTPASLCVCCRPSSLREEAVSRASNNHSSAVVPHHYVTVPLIRGLHKHLKLCAYISPASNGIAPRSPITSALHSSHYLLCLINAYRAVVSNVLSEINCIMCCISWRAYSSALSVPRLPRVRYLRLAPCCKHHSLGMSF